MESAKAVVKGSLAVPLQSQASTIISRRVEYPVTDPGRIGGLRFFHDFTIEKYIKTDHNTAALAAAVAFNASGNLYIHGPTGTGKTHLAVIAARKFRYPWFLRIPEIAREIRSCEGAQQEYDTLDTYIKASPAILDDLGASKETAFTLDLIYEIIDGRYRDMGNGLLVTSNLSLSELAAKLGDDRVPSRLAQMCKIFSLSGEKDWRIKK